MRRVFFFYLELWRSANMPLEGIARTERQAPAVSAILKQTPSPVRGLSLGRWKWEWDWTVQPCWKYSWCTLIYFYLFICLFFNHHWLFQMPRIGPGACWEGEKKGGSFHWSCSHATSCCFWGADACITAANLHPGVTALCGKCTGTRRKPWANTEDQTDTRLDWILEQLV